MLEFIIAVFVLSIFLYAFLAGADFGAGILQLLPLRIPRNKRFDVIGKAIGPVWEANHIWFILALVISFNGFPELFWFVSDFFHFPLGALAFGIIFRGASFTFMHYDPIPDEKIQRYYHWIFGLSSGWCTFWIGVLVGSLIQGDFIVTEQDIWRRYFLHWIGLFPLAMGLFMTLLMMFNASLFLYVESEENKREWQRVTLTVLALLVIAGAATHGVLYFQNQSRWLSLFCNLPSILMALASGMLLIPQYYLIRARKRNFSRIIAGAQLFAIMAAGFLPHFPAVVMFKDGSSLNLYSVAAEASVLRPLAGALFFGCLLIVPSYVYLMKIFKSQGHHRNQDII
jgi:cytochrome bd ubiquinol oxidase subunit II